MKVGGTMATDGQAGADWVNAVLQYWFDELGETGWFAKSAAIDAHIRKRFASLHQRLADGDDPASGAQRALLATVIVLDQFSRNLFRDSARAYAADPLARRLARDAIGQRADVAMTAPERMFLYLPFEHSEDRDDQALSVELFERLGNVEWTRSAVEHKLIIDRFGRFPHRNAALGRPSSVAEIAYLQDTRDFF